MAVYGEKMRFSLVDFKEISCRCVNTFNRVTLDKMSDEILANGVLTTPLILKQIAARQFDVKDRYLEYYAAKLALEKDVNRDMGGMVAAFVIQS